MYQWQRWGLVIPGTIEFNDGNARKMFRFFGFGPVPSGNAHFLGGYGPL